jgi:N-acetylneuraminic acid mutarotase
MSWSGRIGSTATRNRASGYTTGWNLGGTNTGSNRLADNDSFDQVSWTIETDMTTALRGVAAASIGSDVYIFGGWTTSAQVASSKYTGTSWSAITDMPAPARAFFNGATLGGAAYVVAGYNGSTRKVDFDSWSGASWSSLTNLPSPARLEPVFSPIGTDLYCVGGNSGVPLTDVDVWSGASWSTGTPISSPARGHCAGGTIGGILYNAYGFTGSRIRDCDSTDGSSWTAQTDGPAPARSGPGGSAIGTTVYSYCGYYNSYPGLTDVDGISEDGTWASYASVPGGGRQQTAGCST